MQSDESPITDRVQCLLPEREILARLPCGLIIINAQGLIIWFNESAEKLLGKSLQGAIWLDVIQKAFSPRADDGHEVSLTDGRRVNVAVSCLDSLPGSLVTLTDLTATREYEQTKAHQGRLAAIGRMTAQLAHQIRTPLASAIIYTEHLVNYPDDKRSMQWLNRVQESHRSIEKQIEDLLLFARGESVGAVAVDLVQWSKQLEERLHSLIDNEKSVSLVIDNQLQSNLYYLHEESLSGAILNLVNNALQANANQIIITMKNTLDQGFLLRVKDNGSGMSEDVKAQAFAPFFTTKAQGTGLGLAVVQAVVKVHGGYIDVESSLDQGCCVTINLP